MTGIADLFQQTSKVLTVSELTRQIRSALETKFGAVWVHGEVSNYKLHPSGHQYFTLKDARAQIACMIFRNAIAPLPLLGRCLERLGLFPQLFFYLRKRGV